MQLRSIRICDLRASQRESEGRQASSPFPSHPQAKVAMPGPRHKLRSPSPLASPVGPPPPLGSPLPPSVYVPIRNITYCNWKSLWVQVCFYV